MRWVETGTKMVTTKTRTIRLDDEQYGTLINALAIAHNSAAAEAWKEHDPDVRAALLREAREFETLLGKVTD